MAVPPKAGAGKTKKSAKSSAPTKASPTTMPKRAAKSPGKAAKKSAKKAAKKAPGGKPVVSRDAEPRRPGADQERDGTAGKAPEKEVHGDARPGPVPHATQSREVMRRNEEAERMHQDPRGPAGKADGRFARAKHDPRKEYGLAKDRQVSRMNNIVNWFRRAPKPKGTRK